MPQTNIEQFDEIAGQLLGRLYEKFPVRTRLYIKDFVADGFTIDEHVHAEVPNDKGDFFMACAEWLGEAGFLHFKQKVYNVGFHDAVLTAKGLEVLKAVPESLQSGPTLGERMLSASKEVAGGVAKESAAAALKELVRVALSSGVRYLGPHMSMLT